MSKKYDNNLREIKETGTFTTNTTIDSRDLGTLGVYFERDVLVKKVDELKQQLAEKDKEIEKLTAQCKINEEQTEKLEKENKKLKSKVKEKENVIEIMMDIWSEDVDDLIRSIRL